ncbi:hypothetical protein GUI37_06065 [Helcococcus kunzii]|uniref:YopX family protein n=1 Tax=Helcococcus kunzii TaxID=40091 RepID=UPI001BAE58EF|nr:YopX family protein [Helcococcus kunzii]QUY65105.1 hypothetical protein GUI37_06065 [Helcococcus kunzii]
MIPKHRAWDKSINYMDYRVRVTTIDNDYIKVEVLDAFSDWRELEEEQYELMQSTGLKDKNGVEIFEGDILKIQTFDFYSKKINDEYIGQVCFSRGGFFVLTDGHHTDFCLCGKSTATMEVIGKLYENPELLEG